MFEKMKDLGAQVANKTVDGISSSVKGGVDALSNTASSMTGALNDKAVRASTAQMCNILEIAMEELKGRPLSAQPIFLTATVNIGIAALEMQIQVLPEAQESANGSD